MDYKSAKQGLKKELRDWATMLNTDRWTCYW